jgi:hypothetical protein
MGLSIGVKFVVDNISNNPESLARKASLNDVANLIGKLGKRKVSHK